MAEAGPSTTPKKGKRKYTLSAAALEQRRNVAARGRKTGVRRPLESVASEASGPESPGAPAVPPAGPPDGASAETPAVSGQTARDAATPIPDGIPEDQLNEHEVQLLELIRTVARTEVERALDERGGAPVPAAAAAGVVPTATPPTLLATSSTAGLGPVAAGVCLLLLQSCLSAGIPQSLADGAVKHAWQALKKGYTGMPSLSVLLQAPPLESSSSSENSSSSEAKGKEKDETAS